MKPEKGCNRRIGQVEFNLCHPVYEPPLGCAIAVNFDLRHLCGVGQPQTRSQRRHARRPPKMVAQDNGYAQFQVILPTEMSHQLRFGTQAELAVAEWLVGAHSHTNQM